MHRHHPYGSFGGEDRSQHPGSTPPWRNPQPPPSTPATAPNQWPPLAPTDREIFVTQQQGWPNPSIPAWTGILPSEWETMTQSSAYPSQPVPEAQPLPLPPPPAQQNPAANPHHHAGSGVQVPLPLRDPTLAPQQSVPAGQAAFPSPPEYVSPVSLQSHQLFQHATQHAHVPQVSGHPGLQTMVHRPELDQIQQSSSSQHSQPSSYSRQFADPAFNRQGTAQYRLHASQHQPSFQPRQQPPGWEPVPIQTAQPNSLEQVPTQVGTPKPVSPNLHHPANVSPPQMPETQSQAPNIRNPPAQMPGWWKQSVTHLDSTPDRYGHTMRRTILATGESRRTELSGVPVEQVRLADLAYRGWNEPSIRALSEGKYAGIVFTENPAESVLVTRLLSAVRFQGWNIDALASAASSKSVPDTKARATGSVVTASGANEKMQPLIDIITAALSPLAEQSVLTDQASRIKHLQSKIRALESGDKNVQITPKKNKPPQTSGAFQPTGHALKELPSLSKCSKDALAKWKNEVRLTLDEDRKIALDRYLLAVERAWQEMPKKGKPVLKDLAVSWGLPGNLAGKCQEPGLLQIISIAAFCAA